MANLVMTPEQRRIAQAGFGPSIFRGLGGAVDLLARRRRRRNTRFVLPTPQTYYGHAGYRPSDPVLSSAGAPNVLGPPPGAGFNPILSGQPPMRFGAPPTSHKPLRLDVPGGSGGQPPWFPDASPGKPPNFPGGEFGLPGRGGGGSNYYQHPFPSNSDYGISPFNPGPMPTPFGGGPLAPSALRHLYPGGRGFGGASLLGMGGGGYGRGRGGGGDVFGPPSYGPDGNMRPPSYYDRSHTPWGERTIDRSLPGRGERFQGPWRADNRPPLGWRAEAWDRGHAPQFGTGRTGKDRFDRWGLLSGLLRGAGKNMAEGRNSRTNLFRGALANFLKERFEW